MATDCTDYADLLADKVSADGRFEKNWMTVQSWTEVSRYDHSTDEAIARAMYSAVCDPNSGVLQWLKTMW